MINILIVDDDTVFAQLVKKILKQYSVNTIIAVSADEALDILEFNEIHILITDYRMPRIDGLDLCEIVNTLYPSIIKIIVTASSKFNSAESTKLNFNIKSCFLKPVNTTEFCRELEKYISDIKRG